QVNSVQGKWHRRSPPARCDRICWHRKIRMIEDVEDFGAEFERRGPCGLHVLNHRGVKIGEPWAFENVSAGIAECAWRRQGKSGRIEPTSDRSDRRAIRT